MPLKVWLGGNMDVIMVVALVLGIIVLAWHGPR